MGFNSAFKGLRRIGRVKVQLHLFLTSALGGGDGQHHAHITPRPIYPMKELRYAMDRGLGALQSGFGRYGEETNICS